MYKRYNDDTVLVWQYGIQELRKYFTALNNIHEQIQFTIRIGRDTKLAFLDILIAKQAGGTLGKFVYWKPTYTNQYLHAHSHHPAQQRAMISTLIHQAHKIRLQPSS